jgi:rhamnosyltransferase subunit B
VKQFSADTASSEPAARLILCTLGTRGDFQPFASLARRLVAAGHAVDLLTNENWRNAAVETGARYVSIAPADPPQSHRDDFAFFVENTLPSFRRSFEHVAALVSAGVKVALVYRVNMLGMQCAAERFGLSNARVALQPSVIRSYLRPPWPLTRLAIGPLGPLGRHLLIPAIYRLGELFSPYRKLTSAFRRSIGLAVKPLFRDGPVVEDVILMMCPKWFCFAQPDWPDHCAFAGFPDVGAKPEPDASAIEFLRDRRPIVFTPGTGVADVAAFRARAVLVARTLDRPAVLLSPHVEPIAEADVLTLPFVDLGWLLPQCAAIVHHGGIGTTAEAIRAGIPQLIIANRFDQPDNAVRVAQLGLGGGVLADDPSTDLVIRALRQVLASRHVAQQVSTAAGLMKDEDAIGTAVKRIESLLTKHSPRPETAKAHVW